MVNVLDKVQPKNKTQLWEASNDVFKHHIHELNFIDTSKITDMYELFRCGGHNLNVSSWDVSNVTYMKCMFDGCKNFNCDLSNWDVSNVINMYALFRKCNKFTGKGLENWDVSKVTDMRYMFNDCDKMSIPSWYNG